VGVWVLVHLGQQMLLYSIPSIHVYFIFYTTFISITISDCKVNEKNIFLLYLTLNLYENG
jgi:diphthamide synthase subunit DPH2